MALANTDKLTSQLATMPDAALRQLAQMHKSDPYVLPLIIAEDGRRKQIRMAGQAAQYQPQPKVADADAAQVGEHLPEHVGIGALPAPNMAQMAGGGITGEMDVPGYQEGGRMAGDPWWFSGTGLTDAERRRRAFLQAEADAAPAARANAPLSMEEERARNMALVNAQGYTRPAMENDPRRLDQAAPADTPAPKADAAPGTKPPATPGVPGTSSLEAIMRQSRKMADNTTDPRLAALQKQYDDLAASEIADAKEATRLTKERQDKFADAYKGREERLAKREGELEGEKTQNAGLALLQAGFAIMSTPGSLATAVGKGAQTGLASFSSGLEKLKAAQDKLADARDRLDDAKLNRDEISAKEMQAAQMAERAAATNAKKVGIDFATKQLNWSREDTKTFFEGGVQLERERIQQSGADRRAGSATAIERQVFESLLAKHKGDAAAAYAEMAGMKREPMSREKAMVEWMKPGAAQIIQSQYPNIKSFEDYWAVLSSGAGGGGSNDEFTVVKRPPAP